MGALSILAVLIWPSSKGAGSTGRALPEPPESALDVGRPEPLGKERNVSVWTVIRKSAVARATPDASGATVTQVTRRTPEGTSNVLQVLSRTRDAAGRVWVRVRLAVLPNGTTGWLPRAAISGYRTVRTRLRVDLGRLRVTLFRDGRAVLNAPVGVGEPQWPTPRGHFLVRNKLVRFRSPFYGPLAFGTSARSAVLTDWPDGGFVGIHGTSRPDLVPGRVSHGCIRMRNPDILRLARLMPVGTPITVS
jgi:lipoprotein-anchoring transpeptidase ErfK/SrfK